ncbi:MAG: ATP-grasp domain-containing protein [Deltaproteobacteria bacterium]|nr:MAG: ATP-grasp domain-containing protein [Deltaproteobacteria bacterium]
MDQAPYFPPGSSEELAAFEALQARTGALYHALSTDPRIPQDVVIVPSLSLDARELQKISGVYHYEERMLVNLMLLRQPRTRLIFVTSQQLDPVVVDYYLALLPGVPSSHARSRLVMLHCNDASSVPLSDKILARPRLLERIRRQIRHPDRAHLVCFNSTHRERSLAVRLGLPLNSVDPALADLGTKSGCREVFREAGIVLPFGFERLHTHDEISEGLAEIKRHDPDARRAVVKLNDGFSGEGNAVFRMDDLDGTSSVRDLAARIKDLLPERLKFEAPAEDWDSFLAKYEEMGGVVEAWVEGDQKMSPSAQCRVNAIGEPQVISTHDQVLGGPSGQVFLGCTFPAADGYRLEIQESAARVAEVMAAKGVIGRFGIDYVSVPTAEGYQHYAIEINLRKGGTTHPFLTLKFLTAGSYSLEDGLFYAPSGRPKYYFATDTLQEDRYKGLLAEDLVDIAVYHGLHFHGPTERGVVFHLIGALSEFGKVGVVSIGDNPQQARFLYQRTMQVLDEATGVRGRS